jgi:RsiW-degrading membrane proteinase PrsW (M82 family)
MTIYLILSAIIAPAIFWILYLYYKDRFQPEPIFLISFTFILGFASAFICYKSYGLLALVGVPEDFSIIMEKDRLLFLGYCLGIVGFIEELAKFLPFLFIIYYIKLFDEKIDGIIYASVIALGFASYENLQYLAYMQGFELFGRAIVSPLTHTIFSSIWGYEVGKAKLAHHSIFKISIKSITISALFHGMFDFFTTSPYLRVPAAAIILLIWIWRIRTIEKLHK